MEDSRRFRVFVAGDSWRSQRVVQALHELCASHGIAAYEVEVIDLARNPELAEEYRVLAVPMVMRVETEPPVRVIGDLSDATVSAAVLGLSGRHTGGSADEYEGMSP